MSTISDIERNLREAEHRRDLHSDNERTIASQITELRRKRIAIDQEERQELSRLKQPLERRRSDVDNEKKLYERAREEYQAAEAKFKKAEERWRQFDAEHTKEESDIRNKGDLALRQFEIERKRIELAIEQKEREEARERADRINAERDVTIYQKRMEEARREEIETLKRNVANKNESPRSARSGTLG